MLTVTKRFHFEACHHLPHYEGACHNLHGHSYKLEVTVGGYVITDKKNSKCGMIVDFKDLKDIVYKEVVSRYDHSNLNDWFENPTAEIMVRDIAKTISKNLPRNCHLVSCRLWETEDSYAEYTPYNVTWDRVLEYADAPTLKSAT